MTKKILISLLFALGLTISSCSSDNDDEITDEINSDTTDSNSEALAAAEDYFNNTLKKVITSNCTSCHSGYHSGSNSKNYSVFDNAKASATTMYNYVNSGIMPEDAAKLSATEISKFEEFKTLVEAIN